MVCWRVLHSAAPLVFRKPIDEPQNHAHLLVQGHVLSALHSTRTTVTIGPRGATGSGHSSMRRDLLLDLQHDFPCFLIGGDRIAGVVLCVQTNRTSRQHATTNGASKERSGEAGLPTRRCHSLSASSMVCSALRSRSSACRVRDVICATNQPINQPTNQASNQPIKRASKRVRNKSAALLL